MYLCAAALVVYVAEITDTAKTVSYAMQTSFCSQRDIHNSVPEHERPSARYQKVAQLYYTLSECIMVHAGGEPLLDEDVRVRNRIITVLTTELIFHSHGPLSAVHRVLKSYFFLFYSDRSPLLCSNIGSTFPTERRNTHVSLQFEIN